ncbi:acyl-CoA carboxylase subunit epsilon [Streptomyces sp. NPDC058662]|uniref:acyl-CoA carboxylase subunit epsilon n=1 Tax=Streptomyces sp. NPDC058662 TaxID=3346583 RepID=UPI003661A4AC
MPNDVPITSLLRVEKGLAAPEELAAIAVVVACFAGRSAGAASQGRDGANGARAASGRRPRTRPEAGCWAGCWACR